MIKKLLLPSGRGFIAALDNYKFTIKINYMKALLKKA
jgi:hypothetical protein